MPITLQPFLEYLIAGILFSREDGNFNVVGQAAEHSVSLWGERKILIFREVPTYRVSRGQKVHNDQDAGEQYDHQKAVQPHPCRASAGERLDCLKMENEEQDEADQRQPFRDRDGPQPVRAKAVRDHAAEAEHDSENAERKGLEAHFQRVDSTTRCVRNSMSTNPLPKYRRSLVSINPRTRRS